MSLVWCPGCGRPGLTCVCLFRRRSLPGDASARELDARMEAAHWHPRRLVRTP